jgi:hypothetical protein
LGQVLLKTTFYKIETIARIFNGSYRRIFIEDLNVRDLLLIVNTKHYELTVFQVVLSAVCIQYIVPLQM